MHYVHMLTGWTGPMHPQVSGIGMTNKKTARALIKSRQAEPVCTKHEDVQLAMLCSAAKELGVALSTTDRKVIETAKHYGAKVVAPPQPKSPPPPKDPLPAAKEPPPEDQTPKE